MTSRLLATLLATGLWALPASAQPVGGPSAADLFDDTALHELWIHINARDWNDLRATYLVNTFYPCDVEWRGVKARNAGCRSRGFGSRSGTKPGLDVQFDRYVSGQTWLGLTSLVLDNLTQDPSTMKERLSMRLLERMGVPAPREAPARLYIGSGREYAGLYSVVENIDEAFLRRRFGTGTGYLYEYRWVNEYGFEDLGTDLGPYAVRFEPRTHVDESGFVLNAPLRDLVRAITDAAPDGLEQALAPHLDLRGFLRQAAVENYLSEWDGLLGYAGLNNFYLYRPAAGQAAHLVAWDKDVTFLWLEMPPEHNVGTNVLMAKAWLVPELRTVYLSALLEAADAAEGLAADAQRMHTQVAASVYDDPRKPTTNQAFEEAVAEVVRFARERGAIVRRLVQDAWPSTTPPPPTRQAP